MNEKQLRQIWEKTAGHCHFCGDPVDFEKRGKKVEDSSGYWEVDHVIQRSKGGSDGIENCLAACTECNRRRWHRTGAMIRNLIDLGIIARDEIDKQSSVGKMLIQLREKKEAKRISRQKKNIPQLDTLNVQEDSTESV